MSHVHHARAAGRASNRLLIVTADDFGLDQRVNEAVEHAHRGGILNTTSLMVGAPAAADALARAAALPELRTGLHLVLVDGQSVLPQSRIPDLVDDNGRFHDNMIRASFGFACNRRIRAQLAAEIRAQFDAFTATGLTLDHVNTHKHFHLHPTILELMIRIGRDYGLRAIRLPYEPLRPGLRITRGHTISRIAGAAGLAPWTIRMRARLRRAGLAYPNRLFGLSATGHVDEATLLRMLDRLPPGVTEIYAHPATGNSLTSAMTDYDHTGELAALISPSVAARLTTRGVTMTTFGALAGSTSGSSACAS